MTCKLRLPPAASSGVGSAEYALPKTQGLVQITSVAIITMSTRVVVEIGLVMPRRFVDGRGRNLPQILSPCTLQQRQRMYDNE